MSVLRFFALCCIVLFASSALAARIEVPLRVPFEPVRQALMARLAASPSRPNAIYREGPCRYLNLDTPTLEALPGQLRLAGPGSAALGVEMLGRCQNAVAWRGTMQFLLEPRVDNAGRLRMRILDSSLTDAGGSAPAAGFAWEMSKRYLHPRLEGFSYDLGAPRAALQEIIRSIAPPEQAAAMDAALQQLQVLQPRVESTHIVVPIALEVPDAWLSAPAPMAASTAPLTEAEIEALEKALEPLDAFLVYSIRQAALDNEDSALRQRLFTLLLQTRYELIAILSGEAPPTADPVRSLFIDTWNELRTLLGAQRYAVFIDAGDALVALERAVPGLQMQLSADALRQLARSLSPGTTDDPLAYDWRTDPQLQQLFRVEEIRDPERSWLDFFIRRAHAAVGPALDRWVPTTQELPAFEASIADLLRKASGAEQQRGGLAAAHQKLYEHLVPTTALIESCWRQYVSRGGKVTYLRSPAGSVGIMQINQHVWRGFYDVERLRWDTAYNVRAGAQILKRYLKDYAIPYAEKSGDPNHIPRAAYAVYNAGPRAVGRFNKVPPHPREARVDGRLWSIYQGIAAGGHAELKTCSVIPHARQAP